MPKNPESGLRMHYRVETTDGSVIDVKTSLADVLLWEREHGGRSFLSDQTVTAALYVAWAAGRRAGLIEGIDQKGWAATVVDFEVITKDEEEAEAAEAAEDPTRLAPTGS